jgi:hypothetical protein
MAAHSFDMIGRCEVSRSRRPPGGFDGVGRGAATGHGGRRHHRQRIVPNVVTAEANSPAIRRMVELTLAASEN